MNIIPITFWLCFWVHTLLYIIQSISFSESTWCLVTLIYLIEVYRIVGTFKGETFTNLIHPQKFSPRNRRPHVHIIGGDNKLSFLCEQSKYTIRRANWIKLPKNRIMFAFCVCLPQLLYTHKIYNYRICRRTYTPCLFIMCCISGSACVQPDQFITLPVAIPNSEIMM